MRQMCRLICLEINMLCSYEGVACLTRVYFLIFEVGQLGTEMERISQSRCNVACDGKMARRTLQDRVIFSRITLIERRWVYLVGVHLPYPS